MEITAVTDWNLGRDFPSVFERDRCTHNWRLISMCLFLPAGGLRGLKFDT